VVVESYPIAFQQIYKFSKFFFTEKGFSIAVVLSKTPYLSASLASLGAQCEENIFKAGKCFLIPKLDGTSKWQHIVIEREEYINGQALYYYKFRKPRKRNLKKQLEISDVGLQAKPEKFFKDYGIVNHYADESEWLGKHDVDLSSRDKLRNKSSYFPYIVGNKLKFISWFKTDLKIPTEEGKSLADISAINVNETPYSDIQFVSQYKLNGSANPSIWINKVPPSKFRGKALVILSPYLSAFENKMIEVNDLYHDQMLIACNADALPVELRCLLSEQKCYRFSLFSRGFE
jgi:hypothetical protein